MEPMAITSLRRLERNLCGLMRGDSRVKSRKVEVGEEGGLTDWDCLSSSMVGRTIFFFLVSRFVVSREPNYLKGGVLGSK